MVEQGVDVLIVGARVAGSVLAALLGQDGRQVLVIDRATFPSGTLSTHFFRGEGCVGVLRRLGVLEEVLSFGPPRLVREYNADAIDGSYTIDPPQTPGEVGFNLSVRREPLDAILVERARREPLDGVLVERARREPTVEVREATPLRAIERDENRVLGGVIADGSGTRLIRARLVIGADGHASRVAQFVGAPLQDEIPPSRAMYYRYIEGLEGTNGDPDGPEFSLGDDELVYVFPSDGGLACVALSLNLDDYRSVRTDSDRAFQDRVAHHPFIAGRVEKAAWSGRLWACGPRPSVVKVPTGPGWALVGDASMYQDPWTGLGMDNAAMHATFLAEA
ncbi:MAG: NAD(P)/FAD-dependent oxidoreductase, partial [Actinomycetota bacterium]|nr:NAD(P)/FAD-dependent oxidoreductase [Actinomycetota bacterium]